MPPSEPEDNEIIARIQAGDANAFDMIVTRYQSLVAGLLHRFAVRPADLEDLVQEAFLDIWRGLPGWKPDRPFSHWLKRVTVRAGLEYCRKQKRSPLSRAAGPESEAALENLPGENASQAADFQHSLEEAQFLLAALPAEDQALLTLLYLNEMPLSEIAGHFGWSLANAKIRAFRARNRLKKVLKSHGYRFD